MQAYVTRGIKDIIAELYVVLLEKHIHKEDEVLFPWLDSRLTKEEKEKLVVQFEQSNRNISIDNRKYQIFIEGLEQQLN